MWFRPVSLLLILLALGPLAAAGLERQPAFDIPGGIAAPADAHGHELARAAGGHEVAGATATGEGQGSKWAAGAPAAARASHGPAGAVARPHAGPVARALAERVSPIRERLPYHATAPPTPR